MPPFRNILNRRPQPSDGITVSSETINSQQLANATDSPTKSPLKSESSREEVPNEYKLSVVNGSGVYLPPSPPEKQSFWSRTSSKKSVTNHRNRVDENEPFSISRESFDSYRRSFDISAKSPVPYTDNIQSRASLDSRFSRLSERPSTMGLTPADSQSLEEDAFEDVGLADEEAKPKKKGIFARFGDSGTDNTSSSNNRPGSSHLSFRLPGRKRGQSGQGAELSNYQLDVPPREV